MPSKNVLKSVFYEGKNLKDDTTVSKCINFFYGGGEPSY